MDTGATFGLAKFDSRRQNGARAPRHPAALHRLLADADVGDRHGQQDQVGEDDHRHADRGADGQLADHPDVDHQQGDEADGVGEDRDHPRQEQLAEGQPRRHQRIVGAAGLQGDAIDLLHAVGNTDGEDQERHQHRIGIEAETDQVEQAELPEHRDQGGDQHGDGAADAR